MLVGSLLALMAWIAWYALRCRFEVGSAGVQFFGFLPSRLVPLKELEEIAVVHVAERPGQRVDRSYIRMRRRGSLAPFKLSLFRFMTKVLPWFGSYVGGPVLRIAHSATRSASLSDDGGANARHRGCC